MKKELLCIVLLTTITLSFVPIATLPTASATSTSDSAMSPSDFTHLGQAIAPNLYLVNTTSAAEVAASVNKTSQGVRNFAWTSLPQFFIFNGNTYKVKTTGSDSWNYTDNLYTYWVRLVSDPDGSLNATHPKKSGDEVAITTWVIFENGSYSSKVNSRVYKWFEWDLTGHTWDSMTNSSVSALATNVNSTRLATSSLTIRRYLANMLSLSSNLTAQPIHVSKYAYLAYWVDMAFLPVVEKTPTGFDFNAFVSRDRFVALVAYNDANGNGIMDFGVTKPQASAISSDEHPSIGTTEATYVFMPTSAASVNFIPLVLESKAGFSQAASWGFNVSSLAGAMIPVDQSLKPVNTTISSVEFDFHFMRNSTNALTKVDEKIGQFGEQSNPTVVPTQFSGLSLAVVYYSFFEGLSVNKYTTTPTDNSQNAVDVEGNSTATSIVHFTNAGKNIVTIEIGGNTYTWNHANTENANSETIPWYALQGSFTAVSNQSVVQVQFERSRSLYAACFPEWSGYSITHDPYFAVMTYSAQSSESIGGLPVLVLAGAALGIVLAVATVLIVKRRRTH